MKRIIKVLMSLCTGQFFAYVVVSALALIVDVATLYALSMAPGVDKPLATLLAYCTGLIVHYVLAISHVFAYRRFAQRRGLEFALYALVGIVGAVTTYVIVLGGTRIGVSLWPSKAVAVIVSFVLTYAVRRLLLFSRAVVRA